MMVSDRKSERHVFRKHVLKRHTARLWWNCWIQFNNGLWLVWLPETLRSFVKDLSQKSSSYSWGFLFCLSISAWENVEIIFVLNWWMFFHWRSYPRFGTENVLLSKSCHVVAARLDRLYRCFWLLHLPLDVLRVEDDAYRATFPEYYSRKGQ